MWRLSALAALTACSGPDGPAEPDDTAPSVAEGCDGAALRAADPDPAAPGPWAVGARTVAIGRLTVEVWYPVAPADAQGAPPVDYDIREALPASQRDLIGDAVAPHQICDCSRDLPLDEGFGPYPVAVFVHGTAGWRTQSLSTMTHWASRGFVVLAADHPGLWLADALTPLCPDDEPTGELDLLGDADAVIAAVTAADGDLAFLAGHVDATRIAVAGHSAGGGAAAALSDRPHVRAALSLSAGNPTSAGPDLQASLFLGGLDDGVVPYEAVTSGYEGSPAPKGLVGIADSGHLAPSDICDIVNDAGEDILTIATDAGVCGAFAAGFLFDCDPAFLDAATTHSIVDAATSSVLESALQCQDRPLDALAAAYPDVAELRTE
ncbi:MAG: hypothetical protein R3F59_32825 [Myxococcota bacterium]